MEYTIQENVFNVRILLLLLYTSRWILNLTTSGKMRKTQLITLTLSVNTKWSPITIEYTK